MLHIHLHATAVSHALMLVASCLFPLLPLASSLILPTCCFLFRSVSAPQRFMPQCCRHQRTHVHIAPCLSLHSYPYSDPPLTWPGLTRPLPPLPAPPSPSNWQCRSWRREPYNFDPAPLPEHGPIELLPATFPAWVRSLKACSVPS